MHLNAGVLVFAIDPSPEVGGPVLTVENKTDFTLNLTVYALGYLGPLGFKLKGDTFYPDPIKPHSAEKLRFTYHFFEYWFGIPESRDSLVITSDKWEEAISITITKEIGSKSGRIQRTYEDVIDPFRERDTEEGVEWTPRITWLLKWNGDGWKITLKQHDTDTGWIKDLKR